MSERQTALDPAGESPYVPENPPPPRLYRDLCSTCSHAEACGSRSSAEHPILFCELFEVRGPVAPMPAAPERAAPARRTVAPKGLCANCENLPTCIMARPEAGVWHCEEYR